jgi:hypothetical protein
MGAANVLPGLEAWALKDPVLIVMLVVGLPAAAWMARRNDSSFWARVLCGAAAYFAVLLVGKVTSVYYTALPAVAAMLAVWCMLPRTTRRRAPVRAFVSLVVVLNFALAATYFTYRHDWLARNEQLVDWLESHNESGPVFVAEGNRWDVCILAMYASRIRASTLTFEMPAADFSCAPIADNAAPATAAREGRAVLRLGKLTGERKASVEKNGTVIWSYTDTYARFLEPVLPASIEPFLRGHYNHW